MSSTAGYGWSYVDREAERRRQLRAQLAQQAQRAENLRRAEERRVENLRRAELRAQLGELAEHAQGLRGEAKQLRRNYRTGKVRVPVVRAAADADAAELGRLVEQARAANARAAEELAGAVADVWSAVLPEATAAPARPAAPTGRRAPEAGGHTEAAGAAEQERLERVRAGALAEADTLLARDVPRCDPADLERVAALVESLRAAGTVSAVRMTLTDLGALVQHSVHRRRRAEELAELRAALVELAQDADEADRERLVAALTAAEDPAHLRAAVERAVAEADARRHRAPVAEALRDVLRERDYLVGEDFADLLEREGEAVVPFGDPADGGAADGAAPAAGYGLRVVLSRDRATLSTSVVRRDGTTADDRATEHTGHVGRGDRDEQDELVQRWFCEEQLPEIEDGVRRQGVQLQRTAAMAPGTMAAGVVPGGSWPQPPAAATPHHRRNNRKNKRGAGASDTAAARQQQERRRER
ncbi:hypothetical protein [Kitasatospora sp. NPDC047058]|uniref:hypothetical protein n=1 Tax=Kitasatospora sp. NPDC047058 TaxID=3155620 RepID=UPI0033F7516B